MASDDGSWNLNRSRRLIVLLVLAAAMGTAFQGSRGLHESTEGRYAEVAREMLASGDYLHPTLSGQPHYTKPPLAYWAIAAGMKALGENAWGARLANVLAFMLTVLLVSEIGAVVWGRGAAWIAGLIYVSTPLPFVGTNEVNADTLLTLWVVAAMFAFVKAWCEPRTNRRPWWIRAMWVALALGFLTKGPPALLPLAVILIFRVITRRKTGLADPLGLLLFFGIGLWWYVLMVVQRPELLGYFVGEEIVARNLTAGAHRNAQWYGALTVYLPTLFFGSLPWILLVLRRPWASCLRVEPGTPAGLSRNASGLVTQWWFLVPLVVFALSRSRLPFYALQIFPPLALWITAILLRLRVPVRRIVMTAGIAWGVLLAVKAVSVQVPFRADARRLYDAAREAGGPHTTLVLVGSKRQHGFEFYARGDLLRASIGDRAPWADSTLTEMVADIARGRTRGTTTFIAGGSSIRSLTRVLEEANVACSRSTVLHREVVVCEKGS